MLKTLTSFLALQTKMNRTPSTGDTEEVSESTPDGKPVVEQPEGMCPPDQKPHWGSTLKRSPLLSFFLLSPFFHSTVVLLHSHCELCFVAVFVHWSLGHLQTGHDSPTLEQMCQNVSYTVCSLMHCHTRALTFDPLPSGPYCFSLVRGSGCPLEVPKHFYLLFWRIYP